MPKQNTQTAYARTLRLEDALIAPYGGALVQAFVHEHEQQDLRARLPQLKRVDISARELIDLELIASGAYSPLAGYMDKQTYTSVLASGVLPNGMPWGLPITLAVTEEVAKSLSEGEEVALDQHGDTVGVMKITSIFPWDAESEVSIFGESEEHQYPQIAERKSRKVQYLLGGPISMLAARNEEWQLKNHHWPKDLRNLQVQKQWHKIAAIHLQTPWQRSDEYLLKCALESSDALLLHISTEVAREHGGLLSSVLKGASRLLLENYIPSDRVLENPTPDGIFNCSPRAVLQHAILSQNYGCESIFLPSHKGSAAQQDLIKVFAEAGKHGLTIRRIFLDQPFHCDQCGGVATEKSCPHNAAGRIVFSDAEIAAHLMRGKSLPPTVARPDVARAVAKGMANKTDAGDITGKHLYPHVSEISRDLLESLTGHKAGVLWMTGLSGSGKSTIANRVGRELILGGHRLYVLDGDTLRSGLNSDLGFGEEARRENLRRAAEVVKVMVDAGLIVIASFISPFSAEREMVRKIVGANFFEVYVEANLETCEERDPKGLYKRARAGVIPKFTGISSPYEAPENPDLRLNTTHHGLDECVNQLHGFIKKVGLLPAGSHARHQAAYKEEVGA